MIHPAKTSGQPRGEVLSDSQAKTYETDGVIALKSVIHQGQVESIRRAIEEMLNEEKKVGEVRNYFKRIRQWEKMPAFRDLCLDSYLAEIAAKLMRSSKVNLLYDQVFVKEPGTNLPTPWHNDMPYWPIRGGQVVTLWIAFDHVNLTNGGVEFVRKSHRLNARYRTFGTTLDGKITEFDAHASDSDEYVDMPDFNVERDKYDIVSWDLEPGDALAFDGMTIHGAGSNTKSDQRRRAYSLRFASEDVRYYAGPVHNTDIRNSSLQTGDVLDSDQYPVVYPPSTLATKYS